MIVTELLGSRIPRCDRKSREKKNEKDILIVLSDFSELLNC